MYHDTKIFINKLLGAVLLAQLSAAVCTNWTETDTNIDTGTQFTNHFAHYVDQLACPEDGKDCSISSHLVNILIKPEVDDGNLQSLNLPQDEIDAIVPMAKAGYIAEWNTLNGFNASTVTFTPLTANLSTGSAGPPFLDVEPGKNKTLYWVSFMMYSYGTLNSCTNESLNGMSVAVVAPYLHLDSNNNTVVAGSWYAVMDNITTSGTSGAPRSIMGQGRGSGITAGAIASILIATLFLL
ncbi:hypothetical protein BX600DRAFT_551281 [Xylariales sp. PMI_506]|nr:hypothetical protein BX600DRAFT_551281 [Xylariales sp. PMI_506]